jgi:hypothetical protein
LILPLATQSTSAGSLVRGDQQCFVSSPSACPIHQLCVGGSNFREHLDQKVWVAVMRGEPSGFRTTAQFR